MSSVDAWLGPRGLFARQMPSYEPRQAQLDMAHAVSRALEQDTTLLVEAGTGTGKTLAYLVPALLSGKTVVISTGTKTLQDQIMQHDLPLIETLLGEPVSAACMKGLANYLCLRRYEEFRASAAAISSKAGARLPIIERFREQSASGDRAELAELGDGEDAAIWHEVQSGSDTRIGAKCSYYEACFVTRMRRQAEAAQLIIVNHHLFFADLALRGPHGGGVIPVHDAVIFDEAHMIEDVATDFFGVSVSTTKLEVLVRDANRALARVGLSAQAEHLASGVLLTGATFFQMLPRLKTGESGRVPLLPEVFVARLQEPMFALDNALDALANFCKRHVDKSEAVAQIARRAEQVRNDVAVISEGGARDHVTWTQARGRSVSIGSSPVEVAELLREHLYYRGGAVVMTSASLSHAVSSSGTGSPFEYMKTRLGIDDTADELLLPSPFDYAAQAALYLPHDIGDPRDATFLDRAVAEVLALTQLTAGGAFVLCTSLRMMHELAERCGPELPYTVLVQGEAPNATLLERFRSDGNAVLFATAGFWQGVDVPGAALRLVIIDKLPFDVPTDPLVSARCEKLKQRSIEPFMKFLVPSAALTLKQGFGRLIRTRADRGIVAILDGRVSRKGYGKVLLRSLPPATRCTSLDEVRAFWQHARQTPAPEARAQPAVTQSLEVQDA